MSLMNPPSLQERLQCALNNPSILSKCQEVNNLLQEVSTKDGTFVLRSIVESIFGISQETQNSISAQQPQQIGEGWGLRIITLTEHYAEFQAMRNFLSPNGPLLNLIYRLSHDPFHLVPFPVSLFPAKLRSQIEMGNIGPYYASKIQNSGPGKSPTNILFNAFEFYMFHFGYFVVGARAQNWNILWTSIKDSLYPTLLEDYISSYLPCTAASPPGPSIAPISPRGILSPVSQRHVTNNLHSQPNLSLMMSPIGSPYRSYDYTSGFDITSNAGGYQTSSPIHPSVSPQVDVSIWTSQALVQVLMEIWINFCVPTQGANSNYQPAGMHSTCGTSHPSLEDVFVPTADHVRSVRMVVKHFHYFSNSIKPHYPSPLDSLRKNIWPMCRKGIYLFIKHLFIHWPLDSSFRIGLETWLSYIQPWRYITYLRSDGINDVIETESLRSVDPKWTGFVAQNLLFYTHLFSLLVKRLLKLDMTSPKNAQILFRVAKVFSQENFVNIIQEIEDLLEANQMQKGFGGFVGGLTSPYSGTSTQNAGDGQLLPQHIIQMVRTHILEVEKPNHVYVPLFGESTLKDVYQLLVLSKLAQKSLSVELALSSDPKNAADKEQTSWFRLVYQTLFENPQALEEENSVDEMKKCVSHLGQSINQFSSVFNIALPEESPLYASRKAANVTLSGDPSGTPEKVRVPEQTVTENGPQLTEFGRFQLMNGLRRLDLKYEGDPDLKPIGDYEVGFLVRFLYKLCKFINTKYERKLAQCYYRMDYFGSISRLFIQPPLTVYEYRRDPADADRPLKKISKELPPRIGLRNVAQKKVLLYIILMYVILYLFGVTFSRTTFHLVLPFLFTYFLVKAALRHGLNSAFPQAGDRFR